MTTEYKLNTYIEWTDKDRAKGVCPVPAGSDVTVWFSIGTAKRDSQPEEWDWGEYREHITAYLVHSVPREPIVRWLVVEADGCEGSFRKESDANEWAKDSGGRVFKLVEEME